MTKSTFFFFLFLRTSRKVVVLEKKEEETFGFEIQVRGLSGRFWASRVPFNRIPLISRISVNRWWYLSDWSMYILFCKSLNPSICLRWRGWKVTHQSNNLLMLVPWLVRRDGFSLSVCILSHVVYSHAPHVIPALLSPTQQARRFAHLTSISLWSLSPRLMSPWSVASQCRLCVTGLGVMPFFK